MAAGANIGATYGMFAPVHGSAPKYAGMNRVNHSHHHGRRNNARLSRRKKATAKIETAVIGVLKEGKVKTTDLGGTATPSEMAKAIVANLKL